MAHILKKPMPQIADIDCVRLKFQPGDRILVRTRVNLDKDQKRRLMRSIQKFAGCEVEVLIINILEMDIDVSSGYQLSGSPLGR